MRLHVGARAAAGQDAVRELAEVKSLEDVFCRHVNKDVERLVEGGDDVLGSDCCRRGGGCGSSGGVGIVIVIVSGRS